MMSDLELEFVTTIFYTVGLVGEFEKEHKIGLSQLFPDEFIILDKCFESLFKGDNKNLKIPIILGIIYKFMKENENFKLTLNELYETVMSDVNNIIKKSVVGKNHDFLYNNAKTIGLYQMLDNMVNPVN